MSESKSNRVYSTVIRRPDCSRRELHQAVAAELRRRDVLGPGRRFSTSVVVGSPDMIAVDVFERSHNGTIFVTFDFSLSVATGNR